MPPQTATNGKMSRQQFAGYLKGQFPELADFPDDQLIEGVLKRRPELASRLVDSEPEKPAPTGFDKFSMEVGRGMGLDPEKIQAAYGKDKVHGQWNEIIEELNAGLGKWAKATAKDPFHIIDPIESMATGVERGVGDVWKALVEDGAIDPQTGQARDLGKLRDAFGRLLGATSMVAGGAEKGGPFRDIARVPVSAAETVAEGARAVGRVPVKAARGMVGAGEKSVARAGEAAGKESAEFESEARQRLAAARGEHEAAVSARDRAIAAKKVQAMKDRLQEIREAQTEHAGELEKAEAKTAESARKEASARLKENRLNQAKERLTGFRKQLVDETAKNIDSTEKAERTLLDSRWEQFNRMLAPLKGDLSKIGDDVLTAEREDIKGSKENIKVFRDVLGRLKENMIEGQDGSISFLKGQMTGLDQMRGYWQELGDALYNRDLPFDVRKALERVRNGLDREIQAGITDNFGKASGGKLVEGYNTLKNDWSGYKRTWYDRSSVNPLPRILRMLRDPSVVREGIPVAERVSRILKEEGGQAVGELLGKKRQFGAKPENISRLMDVTDKIKDIDDLYEKIPERKVAKFPGEFEPPPRGAVPKEPAEITEAKVSLPKPPEAFDPVSFRREKFLKAVEKFKKFGYGDTGAVMAAIYELGRGEPLGAAAFASYPIVKRAIGSLLDRPSVEDWISGAVP